MNKKNVLVVLAAVVIGGLLVLFLNNCGSSVNPSPTTTTTTTTTSTTTTTLGWSAQTSGTALDLWDVAYIDTTHAWAVGDRPSGIGNNNVNYYNGTSWTKQDANTGTPLLGVSFANANSGLAGGEGEMAEYNAGVWGKVDPSSVPLPPGGLIKKVAYVDASHIWAVGEPGLILFFNGSVWVTQESGTQKTLRDVCFADNLNGSAVGDTHTVLKTSDGGQTWEDKASPINGEFQGLALKDNNLWIVGDMPGSILHKNNQGQWDVQTTPFQGLLLDVCFVSSLEGWAVGDGGTILKTANGGTTWTTQESGTQKNLWGVDFIDASHGLAVGDDGTILKYGP